MIFGFDWLTKFKCNINFQSKTVSINGYSTKIQEYKSHEINVLIVDIAARLAKRVKLGPGESSIATVKLDHKIPSGNNVMVIPSIANHEVEIHHSVCTINSTGTLPLIITNLSNKNLHLNKEMKIASVEAEIDIQTDNTVREKRRRDLRIEDFDLTSVPSNAKQNLINLIFEYADIFSTSLKTIGKCKLVAPPIEITDNTPIQCRPFPVPVALREHLKDQIDELEEAGIIEKSNSRYSFPLILVKKKTAGQYRLVIDYRKLNQITVSSTYRLPLISEILNSLRGANFYSTLDANSSFHQIRLREEDKPLTAFTSPYGNYQYKYLSFGMKNSPQIFQETADTVLNGLQSENISAYIDDIIIPGQSIVDSIRKLRLVFERFRQYGLTLNPQKCKFLQSRIHYLGHIVDKNGLKPLPENLESIKHFPVPNTVRRLRRFLGLANYYRDFIENFSQIVVPLTELTKAKNKFKWSAEAQTAFETIKSKLLSDVMLQHPNFEDTFYLNTDASCTAVGAALLQKDETGILRPISYFSHKLKPHEKKWPSIQLEAYAILLAVRHFKVYLYGRKFKIISDCKSLNYLVKLESPANRLSRWLLELSNYDYEFEHIKGSKNYLGDLLSRDISETVNLVKVDVPNIEVIKQEQRKDLSLKPIIDYLEDKTFTCTLKTDNFFLDQGILKHISQRNNRSARDDYLEQVVVPKKLIPYVLEGSETAHFAFFKNFRSIREKYYWKNMYRDIKNFSNSCKQCIERKGFKITKSPIQNFNTPSQPMELISLDVLGPLPMSEQGNKYILTVIDHFTKYSVLFALPNITARTVAQKLLEVITTFGVPNAILTDLGTNFQSKLFTELAGKLQIHKLKTTPYHPQTNAVSERINTSIKSSLTCLSETTTNWDTYLDYYNFIYNNSYHDTTHEKPSFLMFNRDINLPFHLLDEKPRIHYYPCENYVEENLSKMQYVYRNVYKNLESAAEKQTRLRDKIAKKKSFKVGDKIYLYTPATNQSTGRALAKKFSGPYRVHEKHSDLNYTILDINKPNFKPFKVHVDRMFSYTERRQDLLIDNDNIAVNNNLPPITLNQGNQLNLSTSGNYLYNEDSDNEDEYIPYYTPPKPDSQPPLTPRAQTNSTSLPQIPSTQQSLPLSTSRSQTPVGESTLSNQDQPPSQNDSSLDKQEVRRSRAPKSVPKTQSVQTERRYNLRSHSREPSDCKNAASTSEPTSSSFTDRVLNWAITSDVPQQQKGILDKVADLLASKLVESESTDQNINTISIHPFIKTRVFYPRK